MSNAPPASRPNISTSTARSVEIEADGMLATCLQHEMDHLEGVLFIDHLSRLKRSMAIKKLTKAKKLASLSDTAAGLSWARRISRCRRWPN